ncbi:MAG: ABC transporter ATP-binding protein [Pseudomonadota bacterium]
MSGPHPSPDAAPDHACHAPAAAPAYTLRGVGKRHPGGLLALSGIDLALPAGGFTCLLGASGCGKSTLLRLLAGLDEPSAGTLQRTAPHGSGDIGFVFQEPTLMPWASVLDNVALPLRLQRRPRTERQAVAREQLAAVGLAGFESALPRELSGGMKMRASIARALVTRPATLLLDEPFAALDEISRERLNRDLLALWAARRFTAVFVTHSVWEAVFLAERIVVMSPRPGRVAAVIDVHPAQARDDAWRASADYAARCAAVSTALRAAGAGVGAAGDEARWAPGAATTGTAAAAAPGMQP